MVMSNISFVIIVLLLLQAFSIFASVETAVEENLGLQYREKYLYRKAI